MDLSGGSWNIYATEAQMQAWNAADNKLTVTLISGTVVVDTVATSGTSASLGDKLVHTSMPGRATIVGQAQLEAAPSDRTSSIGAADKICTEVHMASSVENTTRKGEKRAR
jgi:hypothetical protein